MTELRIERVRIGQLKPDSRNPRLHSERQIKQIAGSIKAFGFNVPVLADQDGNLLAGHGRVHAARRLGLREIPVIRLEHLTPEQARAFSIADNRLSETSTWDDRLLAEVFRDLASVELDFDLEATGFTMGEIDLRIEGLSLSTANNPDPADEPPAALDQTPVSRPGDLWQLGRHRLFCGNALDQPAYDRLLQGAAAGVVFTDPPYNVPIAGHVSGKGRMRHREFLMASGQLTPAQFTRFLATALELLVRYSAPGSLHYVCMDWRHQHELLTAGLGIYAELKNMCVWVKDNAGMGSLYRSQHELIFVFKNGRTPHRNNVELGQHGRNRTNVWHYPSLNNFGRNGEEGNLAVLHPTVKPVALIADAILDCSARGDLVLDPFLGSGSTLLAAERVGRLCRGIELDPLYVDAAIRRWQRFTGESAINATRGNRFDDLVRDEGDHGEGS
ncbi:MAG TPA: DNA methyltransferase [Stellaceae bacterium]|nr:DNA methyltransferase [Stellaceae bacterium]